MERINLDDYVQTGEGGTSLTYTHKTRPALAFIDRVPDADTCLHGDLHIGNVITDGRRNLWIDLGQFSRGVPEWDLGWTWTICNVMDAQRTDFLLQDDEREMI